MVGVSRTGLRRKLAPGLPLLALVLSDSLAFARDPQGFGTGTDLLPDPAPSPLRVGLELVTIVGEPVIDITHASDGSGRLFLVSPAGTVRILSVAVASDGITFDRMPPFTIVIEMPVRSVAL